MQSNSISNGPAHPTAEAIAESTDLRGRFAVVTGGSSGIGLETARVLSSRGATVMIGGLDAGKLDRAAQLLRSAGGEVHAQQVDQMDIGSIDRFVAAAHALNRPVDLLIANAGIMAAPLSRSDRGIEAQLMTNVVAHAIMLSGFSKGLAASEDGRFVSLSSTAHHFSPVRFDDLNFNVEPYDPWISYGQSKTGSALLAVKAAKELGPRGVAALAVHPGMIQTGLSRHMEVTDIVESTRAVAGADADRMIALFKDVPHGAATTVWAAVEPALKGRGPLYLENASIAERIESPNRMHGVLDHALDPEMAERLWGEIETMIGRSLPL